MQSWRANCDVQILVYNSSPSNPDISEIAKITDYVVGYQCKGNHTWSEEREQIKQLVMASEDLTGDHEDLKRVAKQVMNKTSSKRIISKQEAMVLLSELPLSSCTETIETLSINNSATLKNTGESNTDKRFVTEYSKRPMECEALSLYDYFLFKKNDGPRGKEGRKYIIPNMLGYSGLPRYPVTEAYARHTILVYTPWRKYPTNQNWIEEFNIFIESARCPKSVKMGYERVKQRHIYNLTYYEPTSSKVDHSGNVTPDDALELLTLAGLPAHDIVDSDTALMNSLDRGLTYEWDRDPMVSKLLVSQKRTISFFRKPLLSQKWTISYFGKPL